MCPQVATEKQAQRTFARLHGVEVLDRAHRLACQLTRPSDWPPGVAPEGERQVPAVVGHPRHRRGGPRHAPPRTAEGTTWGRRVTPRVAGRLELASKASSLGSHQPPQPAPPPAAKPVAEPVAVAPKPAAAKPAAATPAPTPSAAKPAAKPGCGQAACDVVVPGPQPFYDAYVAGACPGRCPC